MSPTQQTTSLERPSILDGTRRHVLDLDDFSVEELDLVLRTTDEMREVLSQDVKKLTTLRGKVVMTLFYEASTRTRVSFEEAGKILSADVINVSASGSSAEKGESLLNTALTLQATGTDLLVVRHGSNASTTSSMASLTRWFSVIATWSLRCSCSTVIVLAPVVKVHREAFRVQVDIVAE